MWFLAERKPKQSTQKPMWKDKDHSIVTGIHSAKSQAWKEKHANN